MDRETIKKFGLRYLGIEASIYFCWTGEPFNKRMRVERTYKTVDTWYSKKKHGIVARFPDTHHGVYTVVKTAKDRCWLALV